MAKAYLGCSRSTEEACDSSGRSQGSVTDGSRDPVRRQMAPGGPLKTFGSDGKPSRVLGRGATSSGLFAQNHFNGCVKNRRRTVAKGGSRELLGEVPKAWARGRAGMWQEAARFHICLEGSANETC